MIIKSTGQGGQKRARTLVLHATSDIEAALLYELKHKLREEPLDLGAWLHDVLNAMKDGEMTVTEVADKLDGNVTAMNNRMARLWKMGLLQRRQQNTATGRCFVYSRNVVEDFSTQQEKQT